MDIRNIFGNDTEIINLCNKYYEKKEDIVSMFAIQEKILKSNKKQIRINATNCEYISPTCMIILSSVKLISKDQNKDIKIVITQKSNFTNKLKEYGFIQVTKTNKNNIPLNVIYKEDQISDVILKLIELSPLNTLDIDKKVSLQSRLYEIPNNSLTHSKSLNGVLYSGYYKKDGFYFSIYDIGIGIPNSVRSFLNIPSLSSKEALKWALEEGNSTKQTDYPRGVGFTLLEEFRKNVKGKILIITDDVYYEAKKSYLNYTNLPKKVKGTLFTFKIEV